MVIGGLVLTFIPTTQYKSSCAGCTAYPESGLNNAPAGGAIALGGVAVGTALGIPLMIAAGVTPDQHRITKFDADLYAAKYNRALLRKTIQETRADTAAYQARTRPRSRSPRSSRRGSPGIVGSF